jgi:DNA polymerase-3 subunit epsilon
MKQTNAFWQLVFLALALTLLFIFSVFVIIWHHLDAAQSRVLQQVAYENTYYLLALITVVPVALWVIFEICYTRFYLPLKKIPAEVSVIYRTNPSHRLEFEGNHNIKEISEGINDLAEMYENLTKDIAREIGAARIETEKERNILASIMAELPLGIIICNVNGRILLFNSQARMVFAGNKSMKRSEYFLGLGRSIYHIIDKSLIRHALDEIEERLKRGKNRVASYFITQAEDDVLLFVETIPMLNQERQNTGFILSLQDISANIQRYESINRSLLSFGRELQTHFSQVEQICSNMRKEEDPLSREIRQSFDTVGKSYDSICDSILEAAFENMPLTRIDLKRFLFLVQKTLGYEKNIRLNITSTSRDQRILGDSSSFALALVFVLEKLAALTSQDEFDLLVTIEEKLVVFTLSWSNCPLDCTEIDDLAKLKITPLTNVSYILKQNRASLQAVIGNERKCSQVKIIARAEPALPFARKRRSPVIAGSRPEYYDFNLFAIEDESEDLLNSKLTSLIYSVIDTETTGLDPEGGDEIIAIGAVRIVKNRIIYEDRFEQLINPERDIPFESYKIHGIESNMVTDKPTIDDVLPDFKRYISNSVIVGHDVGFDLKMIKMQEKRTGVVLANPVLDTLLLSAMLHPIHKQHNIESIAKRLGVNIIGRHTALGDAVAAAEIFLKLLPILQGKGIVTLKDALEASRRTYFLRLRY